MSISKASFFVVSIDFVFALQKNEEDSWHTVRIFFVSNIEIQVALNSLLPLTSRSGRSDGEKHLHPDSSCPVWYAFDFCMFTADTIDSILIPHELSCNFPLAIFKWHSTGGKVWQSHIRSIHCSCSLNLQNRSRDSIAELDMRASAKKVVINIQPTFQTYWHQSRAPLTLSRL